MENFEAIKSKYRGEENELPNAAVEEARENIKEELKISQEESADLIFKKINLDELNPPALTVLNELAKTGEPFPKNLLMKAAVRMVQDSLVYERNFKNPADKKEYLDEFIDFHSEDLKEVIANEPNSFYTEELMIKGGAARKEKENAAAGNPA